MKVSELRIYSIGVVLANKPLDSMVIDVVALEDSPMLNGELTADLTSEQVSSEDQTGAAYQVDVKSAAGVKATWLPINTSNRRTAPDVRRGERVVLYHFADKDELYWNTTFDDMKLRKLETVVWQFSGTPNEKDVDTPDTTYYVEVSTHKGLIHVHTSKKNKEPFGYDIQLNTKEGFFKIQDDNGNYVILDSKEHQIAAHNTDGTYIELNKKNMTINVPETLTVVAKDVIEKIGKTVKSTVGDSVSLDTKTITTNASTSITETTATASLTASSLLDLKSDAVANVSGAATVVTGTATVVITGGSVSIN